MLSSVTGVILLSKLLGFVKQMVTAGTFGATIETDVINLAEGFIGNIQYVLVQVLLTAFTATYIHIQEEGEMSAKRFAMDTAKAFSLIAAILAAGVILGASFISRIIAPSYAPEISAQLTWYLRLFAPALILFVWIAVFHALLNANQRFVPGELTALNQSVILIALILLLKNYLGVRVLALAFVLYNIWNTLYLGVLSRQYWGRSGGNPFHNPSVRKLLRMAAPLLLGYSMVYINQQVDKILSSGLETGTVTAMGYSAVLSNLVGTFIISFCSILFTYITTRISQADHVGAAALALRAASLLVLAFLPISILTILCAEDIVAVIYGRGAFNAGNVYIAGQALIGYAFMFVPLVLRELFSRFQYGYQDSRRPMVNSTIGIAANIVLSIALCPRFGVLGITFATSVSVGVCGILNAFSSRKYNSALRFSPLLRQVPLLAAGGIVCALIAIWGNRVFAGQSALLRFILVTLCAGGGYLLAVSPLLWKLLRNSGSRR